ncbi:MAG: FMN-binding protein [Candidatus Limiplasma sp.]|nr:FMN-binding protein [Candidatus Limiplasma sp.]
MSRWFFCLLLGVCILLAAAPSLAETFYLPGIYTATAQGSGGSLTVEVTFDETQIASVIILEHSETTGVCEPAIESIPDLIVEGQTLAVDAVTGATVTSTAILTAVADCVTQAGGDAEALLASDDGAELPGETLFPAADAPC